MEFSAYHFHDPAEYALFLFLVSGEMFRALFDHGWKLYPTAEYASQKQKSASLGKAVVFTDASVAATQDHEKGEHWAFYVNFNKKKPFGSDGCYVHHQQGVHDAELLHCKITAPAEAKGHISRVEYSCESGPPRNDSPCNWVHKCPELCRDHNYEYDPHDLDLVKTRTVDWWGGTNDGNSASLRFDVFMREEEEKK